MAKVTNPRIRFTYEDYKSLPESDTKRYELLGGELIIIPSPSVYHQRIARKLGFLLQAFVEERRIGRSVFCSFGRSTRERRGS